LLGGGHRGAGGRHCSVDADSRLGRLGGGGPVDDLRWGTTRAGGAIGWGIDRASRAISWGTGRVGGAVSGAVGQVGPSGLSGEAPVGG
jgi:hypothetical protein